jgi:hypothetical protein
METTRQMAKGNVTLTSSARRGILDALLTKYGVEPAEEILKMLCEPTNANYIVDPLLRLETWQRLMEYRTPKLKSVEHEGGGDVNYNITVIRYGEDGKAIQDKGAERNVTPVDVKVRVANA